MRSYKICILSGTYTIENGETVIVLFGKTAEGKSITARYYGFKPYFYIVEGTQRIINILKDKKCPFDNKDEFVAFEQKKLFINGKEKDTLKAILRHPMHVPEYREKCKKEGFDHLASDIVFHLRFFYDLDLDTYMSIECEDESETIRKKYTTELVVKINNFEKCNPFKVNFKILSFDVENSIKTGQIFVICCILKDDNHESREIFTGENEAELIKNFERYIQKEDPDILSGYNINNYDLTVIQERCKALKIDALKLGRDYLELSESEQFFRCHGRLIADMWWSAKIELRPKQETLNYIAKHLLNEEKLGIDATKIDDAWKNNREAVIEYCMKDAELSLKILEKLRVVNKSVDLAVVARLPVDDVFNGRTSTLIDSLLIREADRHNVGVPMNRHERTTHRIEGGYVHTIQPGLYHWVCLLDFKSMYPSIIISKNICFTTISEKGTIIAPNNTKFLDKTVKVGLIPKILENLMKNRDVAREKMKQSKTEDERNYYDGVQYAIKILMNSFYGVLASSFYRFTNPNIGGAITGFARENIKKIISLLENEGSKVIYSDTDSIFVQSPVKNLEGSIKFGKQLSERFSTEGVTFEFSSVIDPLFSHGAKKRYFGKIVYPQHELLVRGYETRRTDSFDLQSETLHRVMEYILNEDLDGAVNFTRTTIQSLLEGKIPPEKLVISRSVRAESEYERAESMANVKVARKLEERGIKVFPGMKVSWIVVPGKGKTQEVEPYIDGVPFTHKPDYHYYAQRIAMTISRISEVLGWDEISLFDGKKQHTLFESVHIETTKDKESELPRKEKKRTGTLDDFL